MTISATVGRFCGLVSKCANIHFQQEVSVSKFRNSTDIRTPPPPLQVTTIFSQCIPRLDGASRAEMGYQDNQ